MEQKKIKCKGFASLIPMGSPQRIGIILSVGENDVVTSICRNSHVLVPSCVSQTVSSRNQLRAWPLHQECLFAKADTQCKENVAVYRLHSTNAELSNTAIFWKQTFSSYQHQWCHVYILHRKEVACLDSAYVTTCVKRSCAKHTRSGALTLVEKRQLYSAELSVMECLCHA